MTPSDALFEATRRVFTSQLERHLILCGTPSAGIVCEGIIAAVITFVRQTAGPEAAANAVARYAGLAAAPVPDPTPVTPEGE